MENKEMTILIEGIRKLSRDAAILADQLEEAGKPVDLVSEPAAEKLPDKVYTYEEVRAVLAEKSRTGFRAEVKALLTAHGVKQLSEVTDPAELTALVREAEVIGDV